MKTYFYSGHFTLDATGEIKGEFSGLVQAYNAFDAFDSAMKDAVGSLESRLLIASHSAVMDAFNLVEE